MLHFILQAIAFQLIFLLVFELFLKKETFFTYNRAYLLLTPMISLLLPLLKFDFLQQAIPSESMVFLPEVLIGTGSQTAAEISSAATTEATASGFQINWWLITYAAGLLLSLLLFLNKFRILRRMFSFKAVTQTREMKIVQVPQSKIACTFYNTIFLGEELTETEREQILSHELVHVRQRHTLDLLYFEFLKILFWFNPLIYIFQSRISAVHEFLADQGVVKKVQKQQYYQQLLNSAFNTQNISFINQFFNHSIIKKRIVMLQKSRSKTISKLKFIILIPLILAMMTYVSCSEDQSYLSEDAASLDKYGYTLIRGEEMSAETRAKHVEYENFLKSNPDHVSWASIDVSKDQITYSIHSAEEEVPEGYRKLKVNFPDGGEYTTYMNLYSSSSNFGEKKARKVQAEYNDGAGNVPFAVIEDVPVFPGCEDLESNEARKECMSNKIIEVVNSNFNTALGKELGLKGTNRIYVQFKITKDGNVEVLGARAPHPALQEEAERVVNMIPQMQPGKQKGQEVGVLYSLPITFKVGE